MRKSLAFGAILTLGAITSSAATFTFNTSSTAVSSSGGPVDAQAVITTGAGVVNIQLFDLQGDPSDASQLLSGFMFTLDQNASTSLVSTTPTAPQGFVNVNGNGPATLLTPGSVTVAPWALTTAGSTIRLNSLVGGPSQTVIGPSDSSFTPNGSLTNGAHNPYINQEADFSIAISGVTSNTNVLGFSFGFGTNGDLPYLTGTGGPTQSSVTPEPGTIVMALSGIGLAAIGASRRKKKAA
jgi:hypothetical protein